MIYSRTPVTSTSEQKEIASRSNCHNERKNDCGNQKNAYQNDLICGYVVTSIAKMMGDINMGFS